MYKGSRRSSWCAYALGLLAWWLCLTWTAAGGAANRRNTGESGKRPEPAPFRPIAQLTILGVADARWDNSQPYLPVLRLGISLPGRYLGRWRLHVDSADGEQQAYFVGCGDPRVELATLNKTWQKALKSTFTIEMVLVDNTVWDNRSGQCESFRIDPRRRAALAVLDYEPPFHEGHPERALLASTLVNLP